MAEKSGIAARREELQKQYWPTEDLWTGEHEKGWFPAPRSLPLILTLLASKSISQKQDPVSVYLDLLSRQRGEGIVEMEHEAVHAYAAGYEGTRAVRTWQERMKVLVDAGFIKTVMWATRNTNMSPSSIRPPLSSGSATRKRFPTNGGTPTLR